MHDSERGKTVRTLADDITALPPGLSIFAWEWALVLSRRKARASTCGCPRKPGTGYRYISPASSGLIRENRHSRHSRISPVCTELAAGLVLFDFRVLSWFSLLLRVKPSIQQMCWDTDGSLWSRHTLNTTSVVMCLPGRRTHVIFCLVPGL